MRVVNTLHYQTLVLIICMTQLLKQSSRYRTCLPQVIQAEFINGKISNSRPVLWTHISNGRSVSYRQLWYTTAKELHKFANDSNAA